MKTWTKILPFFVVKFIAKRSLSTREITIGGKRVKVVQPYKGVHIQI